MLSNQYIKSMELRRQDIPSFSEYPFTLTAVKNLERIDFHPKVTFFAGENGSGKSTLLEAIAVAFGFNPEGGTRNFNFSTAQTHSELNRFIRLVKGVKRPKDGFFFRAESFYNAASYIDEIDREDSFGPPIIQSYGGVSLHQQSHGESFFAVFINRFGGRGLYILDEPEAALSPMRQMSMLARMHELIGKESQFIIATHSPIIMAYPNADIYRIDDGFRKVNYEETEHYQVTRDFVNNRAKMLDILMD